MPTLTTTLTKEVRLSAQLRLVLAFFLSIVLIACDVSASNNLDSGNTEQTGGEIINASPGEPISGKLIGKWTHCAYPGPSTTLVFSETRFYQFFAYYDNDSCSGDPLHGVGLLAHDAVYNSGTYELSGEGTSDEGLGVRTLDMLSDTVMGTPTHSRLQRYDIVYTGTLGKLVFGTYSSAIKSARPSQLDFDETYEFAS